MKEQSLIDKAFLLKKTPLFGPLDLDMLLTLADKMETVIFKKGEFLFKKGEEANFLYVIVEGEMTIRRGEKTLQLGSSEIFGDEALLSEKERGYDAFAAVDTQLLLLSDHHFRSLLIEAPEIMLFLLETYASQVEFRER